jgi:DNA-binding response OmpR family regulator
MSRNGSVLSVGALEIRPDEHQAMAAGHTLALSVRELELLSALARRQGRIVPRAELYETVWGAPLRADDRSVDVYIHKLRVKLGDALPG